MRKPMATAPALSHVCMTAVLCTAVLAIIRYSRALPASTRQLPKLQASHLASMKIVGMHSARVLAYSRDTGASLTRKPEGYREKCPDDAACGKR